MKGGDRMKRRTKIIVLAALIAAIGAGAFAYLWLDRPPAIPVFPNISETHQIMGGTMWPSGWSATSYLGLESASYAHEWYKFTLENLAWEISEVKDFGVIMTSGDNVLKCIVVTATQGKWATFVSTMGSYENIGGSLTGSECVILVAQGPKESLPQLMGNYNSIISQISS